MADGWPRVFLLTGLLGVGILGYATFRLLAAADGSGAAALEPWALLGLALVGLAWGLGVGRELLAAFDSRHPADAAPEPRSFAQVAEDLGLWTGGKKP